MTNVYKLGLGRDRPDAPQEVVLARYEQCEELACVLTEYAQTLIFKENFSKTEVLTRYHQGLLADPSNFSQKEAQWVICRLAELLGWEAPSFDQVTVA